MSPVPLSGSFEYSAAVQADCISKSIMRVTAHELLKSGLPQLYYWPSFEIVRWLGAHTGPAYGCHDGFSVHVNDDLVDLITTLFLETFSGQLKAQ